MLSLHRCLISGVFVAVAQLGSATVLFQDGDLGTGWDSLGAVLNVQGSGPGTPDVQFVVGPNTSLGNPSPSRGSLTTVLPGGSRCVSLTYQVHFETLHSLSPSLLSSLAISADLHSTGPIHYAFGFVQGASRTEYATAWQTVDELGFLNRSTGALGAAGFGKRLANNTIDLAQNPDFSATGGVISEFSIYALHEFTVISGQPEFHEFAFDNFKVEYQPVPEPSTMVALGAGILALRRRRK